MKSGRKKTGTEAVSKYLWQSYDDYHTWFYDTHKIDLPKLRFVEYLDGFNTYNGHRTTALQTEMAEWLDQESDHALRVLMRARYRTKSYLTCAYVRFLLTKDPNFTVLLTRTTSEVCSTNALTVKDILEQFTWSKHLVPESSNQASQWRQTRFMVNRWVITNKQSLLCLPISSASITGKHPHLTILDDVEASTDENFSLKIPKIRKKCREIVTQCSPAANLLIGTPHLGPRETLFHYLPGVVEDHVILQKSVWHNVSARVTQAMRDDPLIKIDNMAQDAAWVDRTERALPANEFASQFLLEPSAPGATTFRPALIDRFDADLVYAPNALNPNSVPWALEHRDQLIRFRRLIGYWDPASSARGRANSVLTIVGLDDIDDLWVFDSHKLTSIDEFAVDHEGQFKGSYERQCQEVLEDIWMHNLTRVYVEENRHAGLATALHLVAKGKNQKCKVVPFEVMSNNDKHRRIKTCLEEVVNQERLHVHMRCDKKGHLMEQFRNYPFVENVDELDGLSLAVQVLFPSVRPGRPGRAAPERSFAPPHRNSKTFSDHERF